MMVKMIKVWKLVVLNWVGSSFDFDEIKAHKNWKIKTNQYFGLNVFNPIK